MILSALQLKLCELAGRVQNQVSVAERITVGVFGCVSMEQSKREVERIRGQFNLKSVLQTFSLLYFSQLPIHKLPHFTSLSLLAGQPVGDTAFTRQ